MAHLFTRLLQRLMPLWYVSLLLLVDACRWLGTDGKASNDGTALTFGVLGVITFFAGVFSEKATIIVIGVLLILA
ncbi:MAG: hypothetical protein ABIG71_04785 [Candidatus Uhrbacteria bacterium]